MKKLDSRQFSQEAHEALSSLIPILSALAQSKTEDSMRTRTPRPSVHEIDQEKAKKLESYRKKSSGLVQGLPAYISTWGLHRLSGDAKKFLGGRSEDTQYKGKVYEVFLMRLKAFSHHDTFQPDDERSLLHLPLRDYTALNHLAMQLAKEWSFWASAVLGEAEDAS